MSHVAANNEIIRMRATVRKARVGVVWKLTKETKLLKNRKHGDKKTLRKFKKKAEKFIREIKAIKRLKDDDITKFAILNTRNLQEVLMDPKVDRKTRVLTKLAFHKHLKAAVNKFREIFPHYKLGKRQLTNHKSTKPLMMTATLRGVEGGNREDGDEDEGINSENAEENDQENEDFDGENSSGGETSEEEMSVVTNNSNGENSEQESDLQNKKPKLRMKSITETSEPVNNEIKLQESKRLMRPRISRPEEFKPHKVSRTRNPPSSDLNSKEETTEKGPPQSFEIEMNSLTKNKKLGSKQSRNPNFPEEDILSAPSNYLRGNILKGTSELTLATPLLQSQKPSRKSEKSSSSNPENFSNILATSESEESPQNPQKIKIVSNLVSVKRLRISESLEETDEISKNPNLLSREHKMGLDRAEDSFFISTSPGGIYNSIIVPRQNTETLEEKNTNNRFRKRLPSTQRASSNFTNSSHHREETAGFRKGHRARQNDIGKNERDFSERRHLLEEGRGAEFRKNDKFKNNKAMVEKELDCERNLHPSWIAKKKQQEILKQGFQGKKIVFSDD